MGVSFGAVKLVVASHRGPVSINADGTYSKAAGGLVSGLGAALNEHSATWIAAPMSDDERNWAKQHPAPVDHEGFSFRLLDLDPEVHRLHYETFCNEFLWFGLHGLFDTAVEPVFDADYFEAWDAYLEVNREYARVLADTPGDVLFVDDYHLFAVPGMLRNTHNEKRPISFFLHTPWTWMPAPDTVKQTLFSLRLWCSIGVHSSEWARALTGPGETRAQVHVSPLPPDNEQIRIVGSTPEAARWRKQLLAEAAGRRILLRVDRLDLSKNALRGFLAFEHLLETEPELADRVWFAAMSYPSRTTVDRYRVYAEKCGEVVQRINQRWPGSVTWFSDDNFVRSVAGMGVADAVLVNPVKDGLNLVAYESVFASDNNPRVILSRTAGAFEHLEDHVVAINPFDIVGTASAIRDALDPDGRDADAEGIRGVAVARSSADWVDERIQASGFAG